MYLPHPPTQEKGSSNALYILLSKGNFLLLRYIQCEVLVVHQKCNDKWK